MATRQNSQSGHSLFEAALVIVPLITLILGIFDVGQLLYVQQTLTERVRTATRYGAIHATDLAGVQNMVLYGTPTPSGTAFLGLQPGDVKVAREGRGTPADHLQITVTGWRYTLITPLLAGRRDQRTITAATPIESSE